jgi:hypothetical protein
VPLLAAVLRPPDDWPYRLLPHIPRLTLHRFEPFAPESTRLLVRVLRDCRVEHFELSAKIVWSEAVAAELQPDTALALSRVTLDESDASVVDLLRHCPYLSTLQIDASGCPRAVGRALAARRSWSSGPLAHCGLQSLTVGSNPDFGAHGLTPLVRANLDTLTAVELSVRWIPRL